VPYKARICPKCRAYQDWRRYLAIGRANLTLLVALISVLTTLISVGLPLLRSRDADVKLLYEHSSGGKDTFLLRNDGRSGALVRIYGFEILKDQSRRAYISLVQSEARYVGSDKEEQLITDGPSEDTEDFVAELFINDQEFTQRFGPITLEQLGPKFDTGVIPGGFEKFYLRFRCYFSGSQKSFYLEVAIRSADMPCWQVTWVNRALLRIGTAISGGMPR
jgi:hypothetical protein